MTTFTVICPTWNRGQALRPTVESVLRQDYGDFELVIASDGSTDDTDAVAAEFARADPRVRLLRTQRYGFQAGPTNEALAETESMYVAYIDHDDLWRPHHLRSMFRLLEGGADFVASRTTKFDATGKPLHRNHPVSLLWHEQAQVLNPLFENSCAAHGRGIGAAAGGWRESDIGLEDWDLWLRMTDLGGRAATTLETTVEIFELPTSRQRSLPQPHAHRLARYGDARAAREAVRRLTDQRRYGEAAAACAADLYDWYRGLAETGELVFPMGWAYPGEVPREVIADHLADAGRQWTPPVVLREAGAFTVALPLAVMTQEHARRYELMFQKTMPRQQEYFRSLFGDQTIDLHQEVEA